MKFYRLMMPGEYIWTTSEREAVRLRMQALREKTILSKKFAPIDIFDIPTRREDLAIWLNTHANYPPGFTAADISTAHNDGYEKGAQNAQQRWV